MLSLFDKFKRDNFWQPFLKATGGTTKFSINFYSSDQSLLFSCWKNFTSLCYSTTVSLNGRKILGVVNPIINLDTWKDATVIKCNNHATLIKQKTIHSE